MLDRTSAPVALGEIGLDYFRLPKDEKKPRKSFFGKKEHFEHNYILPRNLLPQSLFILVVHLMIV